MSSFDLTHDITHDPKPTVVRRLEVINDVGRRRKWSLEAKAEIMFEALAPGATVSEVARRHDLRPQQVFEWLRRARKGALGPATPAFVPVVLDPQELAPAQDSRGAPREGEIEIEMAGVVVRIGRGAEAKMATAVIQALKGGR